MRKSIILILPLFLLACTDFKRPERIEQIDALENQIDQLQDSLVAFDSTLLFNRAKEIEEIYLHTISQTDTISKQEVLELDKLKHLNQIGGKVKESYTSIRTEMNELSDAIDDLKNDINNDNGKRAKYDSYIKELDSLVQLWMIKSRYHVQDCQFLTDSEIKISEE